MALTGSYHYCYK